MTHPNGWHMDRRVPLGIIAVLVIQTIGYVWFIADLNASVRHNADWISDNKSVAVELAGMRGEIQGLREAVERIDRRLPGPR